jgi:hypothetical protein
MQVYTLSSVSNNALLWYFLNFDKTYYIQFTNKSNYTSDIQIKCEDKQISAAKETKFLGLFINNNLSWKTHAECIKSKLSSACYAMRSVKPNVTINTLKMIYYSYFHSNYLRFVVLGELSQQYTDFQAAKEDY